MTLQRFADHLGRHPHLEIAVPLDLLILEHKLQRMTLVVLTNTFLVALLLLYHTGLKLSDTVPVGGTLLRHLRFVPRLDGITLGSINALDLFNGFRDIRLELMRSNLTNDIGIAGVGKTELMPTLRACHAMVLCHVRHHPFRLKYTHIIRHFRS